MGLRTLVKTLFPESSWRLLRRFDRLRWFAKLRLLKFYGFSVKDNPIAAARYVLLDPEIESFSYELLNETEMARGLADFLSMPEEKIRKWMAEARNDSLLTRNRGFTLWHKHHLPLGNRLAWYVMARATLPEVIVEAGIHTGLGSETLLRALERNEDEGHPGKLISFDLYSDTGALVSPSLYPRWQKVTGSTRTHLATVLQGHKVGMFVHDIQHIETPKDFEFKLVLEHAAERLVIVDTIGLDPTLADFSQQNEGRYAFFLERPQNSIFIPSGSGWAAFGRIDSVVDASIPC